MSLRLANLEPGTRYRYRVPADGEPTGLSGDFRTQPLREWRTDPPDASIAIGSCAYVNDGRFDRPGTPFGASFEIFDVIADQWPDAMLWLGDNVYFREPEWTSPEGMSARYRAYRSCRRCSDCGVRPRTSRSGTTTTTVRTTAMLPSS